MTAVQHIARLGRSAFEVVGAVARDYSHKRISMIAAALAFYLFLALSPFLLVVMAALGYILGSSDQGLELMGQVLGRALPGSAAQIQAQLQGIVANRAVVGGLGLAALVWSASGAFAILSRALRIIWEIRGRPMFLLARVRAVLLVILAVVFLLLSIALTSVITVITHLHAAGVRLGVGELRPLLQVAAGTLPLGISFITFLALYRIVPAPRIKLRHLAAGAVFAAVGWEIAKRGFSYYLAHFANFNRVYGPVGAIVVLMLWIHISVIVALIGAELAWVYARREG